MHPPLHIIECQSKTWWKKSCQYFSRKRNWGSGKIITNELFEIPSLSNLQLVESYQKDLVAMIWHLERPVMRTCWKFLWKILFPNLWNILAPSPYQNSYEKKNTWTPRVESCSTRNVLLIRALIEKLASTLENKKDWTWETSELMALLGFLALTPLLSDQQSFEIFVEYTFTRKSCQMRF